MHRETVENRHKNENSNCLTCIINLFCTAVHALALRNGAVSVLPHFLLFLLSVFFLLWLNTRKSCLIFNQHNKVSARLKTEICSS